MLNAGWMRRRRVMVFGETEAAIAIARGPGASRHDVSFLRSGDFAGADGLVIDAGAEDATLAEARRVAAQLPPGRILGVVVDSGAGISAALALDAEMNGVRVRPLCAPARLARRLLAQHHWSRLTHLSAPSTAVIQGTGLLAEHLVIALFRSMHLMGQAPQVAVAGDGAAAWVAGLHGRMSQLAAIGSLTAPAQPPEHVCALYVVAPGGAVAVPAAVPQYWFAGTPPAGAVAVPPFDWRGTVRELFTDEQDARARAVHSFYYEEALRDGNAPGSRPSMLPWDSLPERFRQASRYQADHVPYKLAAVGCREVAHNRAGKFRFTPEEVEALGRVEHERWAAVMMLDGWRYGATRDDAARLTPFLRPFDELTPEIQDRDRMPVRQIPAQLARIGHGVRRDVVITVDADPDAEPGWNFSRGFAHLLSDIAARYPGRPLMLATTLVTPLQRRMAEIALRRRRAALCLLLANDNTAPEAEAFLPRAARIVITRGAAFAGDLHIHVGAETPSPARRLVGIGPAGGVWTAPWF